MAFMANGADMKMIGSLAGESLSGALANQLTEIHNSGIPLLLAFWFFQIRNQL
jgi:hypothetical protein